MMEESARVVNGLKIALRMFSGAKGCIAIDSNRMDAVEAVKRAAANEPDIEIKVLKAKYPQCSDGQLVYEAVGRMVPVGALPVQAGCVVCGVETMVDIERAVLKGRPVMRRIVTVNGGAAAEPKVFNVRTGTSFRELIEAADGLNGGVAKVISGGPMTGTAVGSIDIPVLKDTSTILCLTAKEAGVQEEQGCIRCGRCVKACPVNLIPSMLNSLAARKEYEMFEKNHGMECIEFGSCSYVCPSKRHLVQSFRTAKRTMLANRDK
jgi:electron transport complex protein RnfC